MAQSETTAGGARAASGSAATKAGALSATPVQGATPMMAQYLEIKSANADSLLFYRMGDFYEMFFEDAVKAAEALDITLTKRGQHQGAEQDGPDDAAIGQCLHVLILRVVEGQAEIVGRDHAGEKTALR